MFSILILTKNEAANLPSCIASVKWCDDVVVLDSFSTDHTVEIARAEGARTEQRAFDDFASQRNFALDHVRFKHSWVFHLDADERFTDALRAECERVITADQHSGFMVPSKLMFMGRWLQHAGCYPTYQMRLLRIGEVRFIQHGHGQRESESTRGIGVLNEPYLHFNFSKGVADWLEKHNRYSTHEAQLALDVLRVSRLKASDVFTGDRTRRRRALKQFSFRLPFRPLLRFLYVYLFQFGILDGRPGYHYCRLLAIYDYLTALKLRELKTGQGVDVNDHFKP